MCYQDGIECEVTSELAKRFEAQNPGTKIIVGDGPARAELQEKYPEAKFLGARFGDELARCFRDADVFVFPMVPPSSTPLPRTEMLDLVLIDGHAKGIVVRDMTDGKISSHAGDAVLLCTGGYGNVFYLSTNAKGCNTTAHWRAHKKGAFFANPCFTQIHPTCIPVAGSYQSKLTLMSESLRNDGRVWAPKDPADCGKAPNDIPEEKRDYYLERRYPAFGNLVPRDVASRAAKERCDAGYGVNKTGEAVYLDFSAAIMRYGQEQANLKGMHQASEAEIRALGTKVVESKYGNLFQMYEKITDENPYVTPMKIYPAVHYTMGGLWVDYNLMSTVPGLFVAGEANFSDHGANRLGASALMQGLADGYFVLPYTVGTFLADDIRTGSISTDLPEFAEAEAAAKARFEGFLKAKGSTPVEVFHRRLGKIVWDKIGMARNEAGLKQAIEEIRALREEFYRDVKVLGGMYEMNPELDKANRVADFMELAELMALDALTRNESCGGHFREEYQSEDGEALRQDEEFAFVSAWEFTDNDPGKATLHKEDLVFDNVKLVTRSYK
jgi:succinate dehydrogenase / fumarate reductase flavoprotein subunit